MYSIKPIDTEAIIKASATGAIIVVQDHNIYGGLGTLISKVIAENGLHCKFVNIGIPDKFVAMAHAGYLYQKFGMDSEGLEQQMLNLILEG